MKYKICDWEDNGYHDSYFYGVYFDTEDGKLHSTQLGSTAFAGGGYTFGEEYLMPTPDIVELARKELVKDIFRTLRGAEDRDVLTPGPHNVVIGREFRLLTAHSVFIKLPGGKFATDVKGKRIKKTFPPGTVFRARGKGTAFFGVEYARGYNHPNRENTSLETSYRDDSGNVWFIRVPLAKLRQNAEPLSDEALLAKSEELSHNLQFGAAYGCKAWESSNWAQEVAHLTKFKQCVTV